MTLQHHNYSYISKNKNISIKRNASTLTLYKSTYQWLCLFGDFQYFHTYTWSKNYTSYHKVTFSKECKNIIFTAKDIRLSFYIP